MGNSTSGRGKKIITEKATVSIKTNNNQLEPIMEESNHNSTKKGK